VLSRFDIYCRKLQLIALKAVQAAENIAEPQIANESFDRHPALDLSHSSTLHRVKWPSLSPIMAQTTTCGSIFQVWLPASYSSRSTSSWLAGLAFACTRPRHGFVVLLSLEAGVSYLILLSTSLVDLPTHSRGRWILWKGIRYKHD
jgi:hypothetical protein